MPKFSFKRPRGISKKFSGMTSSIDSVTKSLNDLVFSYTDKADKSLQKKHVMMGISSIILLLVLGSFISPKGKAESSVFYPENCLGGWINPQYAEGEQQTTSNGDETQFTKHNSAVLPKNTNAEMYCGNFKGKFDQTTKPVKIIVSLALTKGEDLALEDTIESGIVGSSSLEIASSTLASTTPEVLILATSSEATTTEAITTEIVQATTTATDTVPTVTGTQPAPLQDTTSAIGDMFQSIKDSLETVLENNKNLTPQTDTVVVPPPAPSEEPPSSPPQEQSPTSYLLRLHEQLFSLVFQKVFAEEEGVVPQDPLPEESIVSPQNEQPTPPSVEGGNETVTSGSGTTSDTDASTITEVQDNATTSQLDATSDAVVSTTTEARDSTTTSPPPSIDTLDVSVLDGATTTATSSLTDTSTSSIDISTTSKETLPQDDNQFQNNFLEVLYTFDGLSWVSLGELNEISMKYRTFEIPVTASTSWGDMSHLQIKVIATRHEKDTPTVYLDSVKVEVLYETELSRIHPDFARDTILSDETIEGMRIVTIINSENNKEEIWYMYLDDGTTAEDYLGASSTVGIASTTEVSLLSREVATTTEIASSSQIMEIDIASSSPLGHSTATPMVPRIVPTRQKNVWYKFEGEIKKGIQGVALVDTIKKGEQEKNTPQEQIKLPDFSLDIIKKIKGTLFNAVIVQLKKGDREELWLYDLENNTETRVTTAASTTIAEDSPVGAKDGYVFWLSGDKTILFAYSLETKEILQQQVPAYDPSIGERGEVIFPELLWKVIVTSDALSFYSEATGEVFSDDNGSASELLRQKLNLDTILDKERLQDLNFQVQEQAVE